MSSNDFRCPACRAKQPLQPVCRRCQADLKLLVDSINHCDQLITRYEEARSRADHEAMERTAGQIALLSPKHQAKGPSDNQLPK